MVVVLPTAKDKIQDIQATVGETETVNAGIGSVRQRIQIFQGTNVLKKGKNLAKVKGWIPDRPEILWVTNVCEDATFKIIGF